MEFDPFAPYGTVVDSTVRVLSWNTWGMFAEESARARIDGMVADCEPDIICIAEAWAAAGEDQAQHLAKLLGLAGPHHFGIFPSLDGWASGIGIASRWPIGEREDRPLEIAGEIRGGVSFVHVDGPRGVLDIFSTMLDYPLQATRQRQEQVEQILRFVAERTRRRHTTILCGDFNAPPDSDEIRQLTGRAAHPCGDLVFYDAWEVAGDGTPGYTFAQENPAAAINLYPDRRFDYVFSAWPRAGGPGHPVSCDIVGRHSAENPAPSDHYGVLAQLRY